VLAHGNTTPSVGMIRQWSRLDRVLLTRIVCGQTALRRPRHDPLGTTRGRRLAGLLGRVLVATVTKDESAEREQWLWSITALKRPKGWRKGAGHRISATILKVHRPGLGSKGCYLCTGQGGVHLRVNALPPGHPRWVPQVEGSGRLIRAGPSGGAVSLARVLRTCAPEPDSSASSGDR
jgi:hypothetical protein